MEQLLRKAKTRDKDAFSDPSNRMLQRPRAVKSGEGVGFQELGSSFGPAKVAARTNGRASNVNFKSAKPVPRVSQKKPSRISDDESDDELLLSSQSSLADNATSSSKRVANEKKQDGSSDGGEIVLVDGRLLKAHPDYKPSSANVVKGLRFSKNKKNTSPHDAEEDVPPPSSSLTASQDLLKPISDEIETFDDSPPGASSLQKKPSATRRRSPPVTRPATRQLAGNKDASTKQPPSAPRDSPQPPVKPRPRPRVIIKSAARKVDSSPESTPRPAARSFPLRSKTPERPVNGEGKLMIKKPSPTRREPQEFPMSLQAKENISDGARSGDAASSKRKKASLSRAATVMAPRRIPLPSPLRTKPKPVSRATTFPNLSPLSSPKNKGKTRAKSPGEDNRDLTDGGLQKRAGPRPFPMSSQMLAGIEQRSKSPSLKSAKRASSDDSSVEQGHTTKKRKDSRSGILDPFDYLYEPMEEDSIELGYARDPSTLCPYCDEDLPSHPTPYLRHLLVTARKKSYSDPRPRNRGGLKAPLTIYISVCQRHRFESHQLPIAAERGWPKSINFAKVPDRVKKMKKVLEDIILDVDDISDIEDDGIDDERRGPRNQSVFWREVKKEMKNQGSRTVVGVKGQFASFEKTQPGYYGEQGSVIIHQTLFDLFPPSTFDASLISPLAPAEFIQRVLVPEAAARLIAQDLCVDIEEAVLTLRDSAQYGVAMFPDTVEHKRKGDGDDEMGVADRIVMERARARRKELAEEEKVERAMLEEERAAHRAKAWESRREKAMERARQNKARAENEAVVEVSEADDARRTRRGTRLQAVVDESESDAMSVDSLASRRPTRIAKKGGKAAPQPNGTDSSSAEVVDGSKRKAGLKANKTKERSMEPATRVSKEATVPHEREAPFGGFAALDSDKEQESTPRPVRQRTTDTGTSGNAVHGLNGHTRPLQLARNRSAARPLTTPDGWHRSLRTSAPDDVESDASDASRRSQRLDRQPIKKGGSCSWLFSDPSSPESP